MKAIVTAVLCTAAILSQVGTAAAQYYPVPRGPVPDYDPGYYGRGPVVPQQAPRYYYNPRNQPMGWGEPYPPTYLADGRLACSHRNYRVVNGWCQRAW